MNAASPAYAAYVRSAKEPSMSGDEVKKSRRQVLQPPFFLRYTSARACAIKPGNVLKAGSMQPESARAQ